MKIKLTEGELLSIIYGYKQKGLSLEEIKAITKKRFGLHPDAAEELYELLI